MKKGILVFLGIALVITASFFGWRHRVANQLLQRAVNAHAKQEFETARVFSEKLLAIQPGNSKARLIYSESVFKDSTIDPLKRYDLALNCLDEITDSDKFGYEARLHEASILLFAGRKPVQAEASISRALKIDPTGFRANQSLFQLYCCTGREAFAEPLFLQMLDHSTSAKEKQETLVGWFLSQFSIGSYNSITDQRLQVEQIVSGNIPVDQKRLLLFRESEPDELLSTIALAYWFLIRRDGQQAKKILDEVDPEKVDPSNPLYLMTAVNVYFEVGEIDLAKQLHEYWTSKEYFEYWRQLGVISQDYERDYSKAVGALQKSLKIWPGVLDPSIYHRLNTCLERVDQSDDAIKIRDEGNRIKSIVEPEKIRTLQSLVLAGNLDRSTCMKMSEFYTSLSRGREADAWNQLGEIIEKSSGQNDE